MKKNASLPVKSVQALHAKVVVMTGRDGVESGKTQTMTLEASGQCESELALSIIIK